MARKKKDYYTLIKYLEENHGFSNKSARENADEVYEKWLEEGGNIIGLWNKTRGEDLSQEDDFQFKVEEFEKQKDEAKNIREENKGEFIISGIKHKDGQDEKLENLAEKIKPASYSKAENIEPQKFDWEKYLEENPQFIALNKQMAKSYGKIDDEKISKKKEREVLETLDDKFKIVLLQFFKDIAHKQGFASINYSPIGQAHEGYAGLVCSIQWSNSQITSGVGDAHYNNTTSFTKHYCGPMAENRSFVRAVKQFFNISLLGADEIGETPEEGEKKEPSTGPHVILKKVAKEKLGVITFSKFKEYLKTQLKNSPENPWIKVEEYEEWANYKDWPDVKKSKIAELVENIKKL